MSSIFAKAAIISFIINISVFIVISQIKPNTPQNDSNTVNIENIKTSGLWWLYPALHETTGRTIRLQERPDLFHAAFAGYPITLLYDEQLWNKYFKFTFDFDLRMPASTQMNDPFLMMSWLGNLEILKKYGADTLIFGSSEAHRELMPDLFSKSISTLNNYKKFLFLTRFGMLQESVTKMALIVKEIKKTQEKKKLDSVVVGYSFWWADFQETAEIQEQNILLKNYFEQHGHLKWLYYNGPTLFNVPTWGDIAKIRYLLFIRPRPRSPPPIKGKLIKDLGDNGYLLFKDDVNQIAEMAKYTPPYSSALQGQKLRGCTQESIYNAKKRYKQMLIALNEIAEKIYIYLTPVTPLHSDHAHPCLRDYVKKMLVESASTNIKIKVSEWEDYGLTWQDFVFDGNTPETMRLDPNHTNRSGAEKVTKAISHWIKLGGRQ
ncbi:MAG: hypothetical protein IPM57_09595 [Oligoflexia bacterium]|nr:hypothetical protein [Oligoflexia bacterium]